MRGRFKNADGESLCQKTQKRGGGLLRDGFVEMWLLVETLREWHQSLSEMTRGFGACGRAAERAHVQAEQSRVETCGNILEKKVPKLRGKKQRRVYLS